jgi:hypothetical protein
MTLSIGQTIFALLLAAAPLAAQQVVNIQDFGAIPDDGQDDSAAIQAAFRSLDPAKGGTVFCPPGTYDIASPIVVESSAVRFRGDAGVSYNETAPYAGCMLVARTDGMTLLQFASPAVNHRGPLIEYVNLRDGTPAGHSATLLDIKNMNRWTVRNVSLNYANTGLKITAPDDASWGYIAQLFCKESNTCVDQSSVEGGFLALGGGLEPLVTGIRVRGSQVRVMGVKFDCVSGSTGIDITGHAASVTASVFEQCGTGILVRNDATQPWNGAQNRFIGNHFLGWKSSTSRGIAIGPGASGNQLAGNTYEYPAIAVEDKGSGTVRLEQGMGPDLDINCPKGQSVTSLRVRNGVVTGAACSQP